MAWLHAGVFALAALLGGADQPYAATHPAVYAGTYAVRMCHGACAGSSAVPFRSGTLVLFKQPLKNQRGHTFRNWLDRHDVNGCFVIAPPASLPNSKSYVPPQGFFSWEIRERAVVSELTRSPDGGYAVTLKLSAKALAGWGTIWGCPGWATTSPLEPLLKDSVVADRIGEPDISRRPSIPASAERID